MFIYVHFCLIGRKEIRLFRLLILTFLLVIDKLNLLLIFTVVMILNNHTAILSLPTNLYMKESLLINIVDVLNYSALTFTALCRARLNAPRSIVNLAKMKYFFNFICWHGQFQILFVSKDKNRYTSQFIINE